MNDRMNCPGSDPDDDTAPPRLSPVAVAARLALGVVGCVALSGVAFAIDHANRPETRPFTVAGQVSLTSAITTSGLPAGFGCAGADSDPVTPGTDVTVRDDARTPLATGRLETSAAIEDGCTFEFSVADVPRGHDSYRVTIGRLGGFTLSAKQAEAGLFILVAT